MQKSGIGARWGVHPRPPSPGHLPAASHRRFPTPAAPPSACAPAAPPPAPPAATSDSSRRSPPAGRDTKAPSLRRSETYGGSAESHAYPWGGERSRKLMAERKNVHHRLTPKQHLYTFGKQALQLPEERRPAIHNLWLLVAVSI